jgi:DNA-binding MarR family transcriptional regulator
LTTTTSKVGADHDLGEAVLTVARALFALRVSPQTFDIDRRVDRAAYGCLARITDMGPLRMSELAGILCVDLSTVSRQVRALEDLGLLRRTPEPDDRRASLLEPTDDGRALVDSVKTAFSQLMEAALADWSERDRRTLTTLLTRLASDLRPDRAPHLIATVTTTTEKLG